MGSDSSPIGTSGTVTEPCGRKPVTKLSSVAVAERSMSWSVLLWPGYQMSGAGLPRARVRRAVTRTVLIRLSPLDFRSARLNCLSRGLLSVPNTTSSSSVFVSVSFSSTGLRPGTGLKQV